MKPRELETVLTVDQEEANVLKLRYAADRFSLTNCRGMTKSLFSVWIIIT